MITFTALGDHIPAGSLEYVGNNQVKLNFSQLSNDSSLNLDSSALKPITLFLEGLFQYTHQLNVERKNQKLDPIELCSKNIAGTPDKPIIAYTLSVEVDAQSFLNNLVDPTA